MTWEFGSMTVGSVVMVSANKLAKAMRIYNLYGKITCVKLPTGEGLFWKYPEHLTALDARVILLVRSLRPKVFSGGVFSGGKRLRGPGLKRITELPEFIRMDGGEAVLTDRGESLFVPQPRMVKIDVPENLKDDVVRYIEQRRRGLA